MSRSATTQSTTRPTRLSRPDRSHFNGRDSLVVARAQLALRRLDQRRLIALIVAGAAALLTFSTVSEAQRRSTSLGQTQLVAIARTDMPAGSTISSSHVDLVERPIRFIPADAIGTEAQGAILLADVAAGEAIVSQRIAVPGSPLAPGERAVTVPTPLAPPLLEVGDNVEVVGLQTVDLAGSSAPTVSATVVTTGRVLALTNDAVTVAMPDTAALDVLRFQAVGAVELLLSP